MAEKTSQWADTLRAVRLPDRKFKTCPVRHTDRTSEGPLLARPDGTAHPARSQWHLSMDASWQMANVLPPTVGRDAC